jgi:hypothetical protein
LATPWSHLKGVAIAFVVFRFGGRRGEEEPGSDGLRAHIIDLAHVDEKTLGENWDNDVFAPVRIASPGAHKRDAADIHV